MRTGIFICHCGHNIKHTVDVRRLSAYFKTFPSVVVAEDYPFVCSEPGQDMIAGEHRKTLPRPGDHRLLHAFPPSGAFQGPPQEVGPQPVLAQKGRHKGALFMGGRRRGRQYRKGPEAHLAGLYSASHYVPLEEKQVEVAKSALVIGGRGLGSQRCPLSLEDGDAGFSRGKGGPSWAATWQP